MSSPELAAPSTSSSSSWELLYARLGWGTWTGKACWTMGWTGVATRSSDEDSSPDRSIAGPSGTNGAKEVNRGWSSPPYLARTDPDEWWRRDSTSLSHQDYHSLRVVSQDRLLQVNSHPVSKEEERQLRHVGKWHWWERVPVLTLTIPLSDPLGDYVLTGALQKVTHVMTFLSSLSVAGWSVKVPPRVWFPSVSRPRSISHMIYFISKLHFFVCVILWTLFAGSLILQKIPASEPRSRTNIKSRRRYRNIIERQDAKRREIRVAGWVTPLIFLSSLISRVGKRPRSPQSLANERSNDETCTETRGRGPKSETCTSEEESVWNGRVECNGAKGKNRRKSIPAKRGPRSSRKF